MVVSLLPCIRVKPVGRLRDPEYLVMPLEDGILIVSNVARSSIATRTVSINDVIENAVKNLNGGYLL